MLNCVLTERNPISHRKHIFVSILFILMGMTDSVGRGGKRGAAGRVEAVGRTKLWVRSAGGIILNN